MFFAKYIFRVDHAIKTVGYVTTGEFTDYAGKFYKDLVSVSPELGTQDSASRNQNPGPAQIRKIIKAVGEERVRLRITRGCEICSG